MTSPTVADGTGSTARFPLVPFHTGQAPTCLDVTLQTGTKPACSRREERALQVLGSDS